MESLHIKKMSTDSRTLPFNPQMLKLNIGGKKYITTEATLISKGSNFFSAFLDNIRSGTMKCVQDEEGCIFIDRNGAAFESVLEYLRTGNIVLPKGISRQQVVTEFDFYSLQKGELETESFKLARHQKWDSMAQLFFSTYWTGIRDNLYELVTSHGLNCCSLTLVHETVKNETEEVQRYYNNIRVCLDSEIFPPPLKPLFLDNVIYIFREYGFDSSYVNRQQTVDINLSWYQRCTLDGEKHLEE